MISQAMEWVAIIIRCCQSAMPCQSLLELYNTCQHAGGLLYGDLFWSWPDKHAFCWVCPSVLPPTNEGHCLLRGCGRGDDAGFRRLLSCWQLWASIRVPPPMRALPAEGSGHGNWHAEPGGLPVAQARGPSPCSSSFAGSVTPGYRPSIDMSERQL